MAAVLYSEPFTVCGITLVLAKTESGEYRLRRDSQSWIAGKIIGLREFRIMKPDAPIDDLREAKKWLESIL